MYRVQEKPDDKVAWSTPLVRICPVVTLVDEYGGRAQIVEDDHCYVVLLLDQETKQDYGAYIYNAVSHIFPEAMEALRALPPLKIPTVDGAVTVPQLLEAK